MLQGVGLPYLSWLQSTLGASLGRMTTSQFCQMYVRPFTSHNRCSVAEQLMAKGETAKYVGDATWFISHTWSNAFADTLDAVLLFFEGREDAGSARVPSATAAVAPADCDDFCTLVSCGDEC